jgi:hypothetical protein
VVVSRFTGPPWLVARRRRRQLKTAGAGTSRQLRCDGVLDSSIQKSVAFIREAAAGLALSRRTNRRAMDQGLFARAGVAYGERPLMRLKDPTRCSGVPFA